jgi:PH (Pleckstrin Homology) domain-containing protein
VFHRSPAARPAPAAGGPAGIVPGREVYRLATPVILWWVWLVFVVANIIDFAIQGAHGSSARFVIVVAGILAAVTGLAYALALRPRVIADHVGLAIVNPFRDHRVPWAAIQTVDTGDWVRVHYAPGGDARGAKTSAVSQSISCWALYVSARTKRKAARPPRPRRSWFPALPGGLDKGTGGQGNSRLPEEAKYLASLPPAKAIASRLDTRAAKERARGEHTGPVTARWAWPPLVAVAVPALALLIIALA